MKAVKVSLFLSHLLIGIFALMGGWVAFSDTDSPFGLSTVILANSPFENFFIPGILLFTTIGLGQMFSAGFFVFRSRYQGYVSGFFAGVLIIWLMVQVWMLQLIEPMHVVTAVLAVVQLTLAAILTYQAKFLTYE